MEMFVAFLAIFAVLAAAHKIVSVIAKAMNWQFSGDYLFPLICIFVGNLFSDYFPHQTPGARTVGLFITGSLGAIAGYILVLIWQNIPSGPNTMVGRLAGIPFVVKVVTPAFTLLYGIAVGVIAIALFLFFFRDNQFVSPLLKWIFALLKWIFGLFSH